MHDIDGIIMAFDYGSKKIGVAVGQQLTKTASPLATVFSGPNQTNWESIDQHIKQWRPSAFVVGLPLQMNNKPQHITHLTLRFIKALEKTYQKPIFKVDERLSTQAAKAEIFEQKGYRGLKNTEIDSIAACLILENWLNQL